MVNEFDKLTGVYTREAFCRHAEELVRQNPDKRYDIILSDFVGFKYFNERYGTEKGDLLLAKTGQMLGAVNGAICGRYGSDMFVSLVEHINEVGIQWLEHFTLPAEASEELYVPSVVVKFGICQDVDLRSPITAFCDRAQLAVDSIKHQYGTKVAIYDDSIGNAAIKEIIIEENMLDALNNSQFEVYYQPKYTVATGEICGAEALVRWNHPTIGNMTPGSFIQIFEKNGFITELDLYIWEKVCQDISQWRRNGLPLVPISINASRKDFGRDNFSDVIIEIMDQYQIDHNLCAIELTESSYADKPEQVGKHVAKLSAEGINIELDDFGTGFTSLGCLSEMHIDVIKFDMSLIKTGNEKIVSFAMQLAKLMNLRTIQEGVETEEELEQVKKLGVDAVQGYLFSRPLTEAEFAELLKR